MGWRCWASAPQKRGATPQRSTSSRPAPSPPLAPRIAASTRRPPALRFPPTLTPTAPTPPPPPPPPHPQTHPPTHRQHTHTRASTEPAATAHLLCHCQEEELKVLGFGVHSPRHPIRGLHYLRCPRAGAAERGGAGPGGGAGAAAKRVAVLGVVGGQLAAAGREPEEGRGGCGWVGQAGGQGSAHPRRPHATPAQGPRPPQPASLQPLPCGRKASPRLPTHPPTAATHARHTRTTTTATTTTTTHTRLPTTITAHPPTHPQLT